MKKILSLLLALALLLSLSGCIVVVDPDWLDATTAPTAITTEATTEPSTIPIEATTVPETTEATEPSAEATEPSVVATEPVQTQPDNRDEPTYPTQPDDRYEDTYPTQPDDRYEEDTRPRPTEPATEPATEPSTEAPTESQYPIDPNGHYTSRDDVALYIHVFGRLPNNYISKYQGNLQYGSYKNIPYYMNIGGDVFQNREGLLPRGCTYFECDIDTAGGRNRGTRRIVFSSDGAVYYTSDHYASFIQLY